MNPDLLLKILTRVTIVLTVVPVALFLFVIVTILTALEAALMFIAHYRDIGSVFVDAVRRSWVAGYFKH